MIFVVIDQIIKLSNYIDNPVFHPIALSSKKLIQFGDKKGELQS